MLHLTRSSKACLYYSTKVLTDATGIPVKPTWSVHELLASYPKPKLSNETFKKLHRLSALQHPSEDSPQFSQSKEELEQLIKLVEAVKLVDTVGVQVSPPPPISEEDGSDLRQEPSGRELFEHSNSVEKDAGFYVVKTPKAFS